MDNRMPVYSLERWPLINALGKQRYLALSLLAFLCIMPLIAIMSGG